MQPKYGVLLTPKFGKVPNAQVQIFSYSCGSMTLRPSQLKQGQQ